MHPKDAISKSTDADVLNIKRAYESRRISKQPCMNAQEGKKILIRPSECPAQAKIIVGPSGKKKAMSTARNVKMKNISNVLGKRVEKFVSLR